MKIPELPRQNLELKANTDSLDFLRECLMTLGACYSRTMYQVDTYFNAAKGRLKLREIENGEATLVYYERPDLAEARYSNYQLSSIPGPETFKGMMSDALGVKAVVEKKRELWIYGDTRVHLDTVADLGEFVELETVIQDQSKSEARSEHRCVKNALQISESDRIPVSYSDLVLRRRAQDRDL